MKSTAYVFYPGGLLMLPATTPYEREMLVEHVRWYARRQGRVSLRLDGHEWSVGTEHEDEGLAICAVCAAPRRGIAFTKCGCDPECTRCFRQELCTSTARWPWHVGWWAARTAGPTAVGGPR